MAEVAVIVPARNAAATIESTLRAIAELEFDRPFDVIVVDDASTDETAAIAARHGAQVVTLPLQSGPGAARNAGVAATTASSLAFTDADCTPSRSWLRAGISALARGADLVTGPIRPVEDTVVGPFDRTLSVEGPSPLFESANVFVSRELFERLDGFRRPPGVSLTVAQGHFGEDVVFGWRAMRAGAVRRHAAEAVVFHAVFPRGPAGYLAERLRLRLFPGLVSEVPELRGELPARIFLSRRTMRFDLALAGCLLALALRRPAPLLAAVPYLKNDLWRGAGPSAIGRNAIFAAGDLIGLAALLRGSISAKTPVL